MGAMTAAGFAMQGVGSAVKMIDGISQARKARKALENYRRQKLNNAYRNLQVSRLGADLRTQEGQRMLATGVDALRTGGVRGMVGGLGRMTQGANVMNREIAANLDEQQRAIDMAVAQDETNIRAMQEQRENMDIQGLGQQLEVGRQNMMSGLSDIGNTMAYAGMYGDYMGKGGSINEGTDVFGSAKSLNLDSGVGDLAKSTPTINSVTANIDMNKLPSFANNFNKSLAPKFQGGAKPQTQADYMMTYYPQAYKGILAMGKYFKR